MEEKIEITSTQEREEYAMEMMEQLDMYGLIMTLSSVYYGLKIYKL